MSLPLDVFPIMNRAGQETRSSEVKKEGDCLAGCRGARVRASSADRPQGSLFQSVKLCQFGLAWFSPPTDTGEHYPDARAEQDQVEKAEPGRVAGEGAAEALATDHGGEEESFRQESAAFARFAVGVEAPQTLPDTAVHYHLPAAARAEL
jgi:hypothetical protein